MAESPPVRSDVAGHVATLTLDRPDSRNALSDELLDGLLATLRAARDDEGVRVVVIASSHERVFSAGGNLAGFTDERSLVEKLDGMGRFPELFRLLGALGKPVICAANGYVLAGALGLALACDLVIAKESARFGAPEITVGAFPFMISALIKRNVGRLKANELMLLGEQMTAHEAAALGLVNKVVPDSEFDEAVARWAGALAARSPLLMRLGKNAVEQQWDLPRDASLPYLQAQLAIAFATHDLHEGVTAFFDKREPQWQGR
jgi:enoyl-CoA hydratase